MSPDRTVLMPNQQVERTTARRDCFLLVVGGGSSGANSRTYCIPRRSSGFNPLPVGGTSNALTFTALGVNTITPSAIDLATPPASFTVTGGGFADRGFGLPVVNFTRGGQLLAQARATALTGGITLTVPFPTSATSLTPGVPGLLAGSVDVQVFNQTGAGGFSLVGSIGLTVTDSRPCVPPCVKEITPNSIDLAAPPASFTLTGGGFADVGFGLPVVNFTRGGQLLAQARATALTGTTLTVPFPTNATSLSGPLPGLSAGQVTVSVVNIPLAAKSRQKARCSFR